MTSRALHPAILASFVAIALCASLAPAAEPARGRLGLRVTGVRSGGTSRRGRVRRGFVLGKGVS